MKLLDYYTLKLLLSQGMVALESSRFPKGPIPQVLFNRGLLTPRQWQRLQKEAEILYGKEILATRTLEVSGADTLMGSTSLHCPSCAFSLEISDPPSNGLPCIFCQTPMGVNQRTRETREMIAGNPAPNETSFFMGKYQILCKLGEGGMGAVYKAIDPALQRTVAIKVITGKLAGASDEAKARFELEAKVVAKLAHPHIIPLYDMGVYRGNPYYTMAYMEGLDLRKYVAKKGPLSQKEALQIMLPIVQAVMTAHEQGVIHRDIKPENIMLDQNHKAYLMDFGLAKEINARDNSLTRTGAIVGSPEFMSPEQAYGAKKEISFGADIYGLGGVLYFLLSGRPPFTADDLIVLLRMVVEMEPQPLRRLADVSQDLETVVQKCLEKEPHRRYPNVGMVYYDLKAIHGGNPILARPLSPFEKGKRWIKKHPVVMVGVLAVFITALVLFFGTKITENLHRKRGAQKLFLEAKRMEEDESRKKDPTLISYRELEKKYPLFYKKFQRETQKATERRKDSILAYLKIQKILEKALVLDPKNQRVYKKWMDILFEIYKLSLMGQDYILARIVADWCAKVDQTKGKKWEEGIARCRRNVKKKIRSHYLNRLAKIMKSLERAPAKGEKEEYVTALVKMGKNYMVRELLRKISSPYLWQRLVAIGTLGKIGDKTTTYKHKNSVEWLIDRLKILDSRINPAEAKALVWALGRLGDSLAERVVSDMRYKAGENSPFWNATQFPYNWISSKAEPKKNSPKAWLLFGISLALKGEYKESISAFTRAISFNHKLEGAYNGRGNVYRKLKFYKKAISDFTKAIAIDPRYVRAYNNRGIAYRDLKSYDKAISDFTRAISLNPKYARAYSNRGIAYRDLKSYGKAISDFTKALSLNPKLAPAYHGRGNVYNHLKSYDKAISDYTRVISLNPKSAKPYNGLGNVYSNLKLYDKAIWNFTRAIALDPRYPKAYNNRGIAYFKLKLYKDSISDFTRAISLDPQYARAYMNRGIVYSILRKHKLAAPDFRTYLQLTPKAPQRTQLEAYIRQWGGK